MTAAISRFFAGGAATSTSRTERTGKMTTFRLFRVLLFLPLCLFAASAAAQCCGDCDRNGRVAANELVTAVNNALDGGCSAAQVPIGSATATPAPTPTVLPDQCATDAPGTRLTILGTNYVIVEYEVVLEDSPDTYLLRYPTALNTSGHLANPIQNPFYLQRTCANPSRPCGSGGFGGQPGNICGFPAFFYDAGSVTGDFPGGGNISYTEGTTSGAATWSYSARGFLQAYVTVDAAHTQLYLFFSGTLGATTVKVPPLGSFGYSFASANYPKPTSAEIAQLHVGLSSLFAHVSLRRASLPAPPPFPATPTPGACLKKDAACDFTCFVTGQTSCCPPLVCGHNSAVPDPYFQCVPQGATPTGPPPTETPPCPR